MKAAYVVATGSHTEAQLEEETDANGIFPDMNSLAEKIFNF